MPPPAARIDFGPCICGAQPGMPMDYRPAWATIAGWDGCVQWVGGGRANPPAAGGRRQAAGGREDLHLTYPFQGSVGADFWCHWVPALSDMNGYDEHPLELEHGRLVRARIVSLSNQNTGTDDGRNARTAEADILTSLSYEDLLSGPDLETTWDHQLWPPLVPEASSCNLHFNSRNIEGDVGQWVIWTEVCAFRHVLVCGSWGRHEDFVYAGHGIVRPTAKANNIHCSRRIHPIVIST